MTASTLNRIKGLWCSKIADVMLQTAFLIGFSLTIKLLNSAVVHVLYQNRRKQLSQLTFVPTDLSTMV